MIPFSLTSEPLDHALALFVHGELDISTAPLLRAALAEIRQQGSLRCLLDLSACTFLDSTGSRTIALEGEEFEQAGSALAVHCPIENRSVRFVVELVGLPEVMTVTPPSDAPAD
jgi:anti-sigma B factor antagonist